MQKNGYSLGGEQSGHIIIKKYATTGDGILTAIMLAEEMCDTKASISSLSEKVTLYPQYTKNVRVKNKSAVISDEKVIKTAKGVEEKIGGKGRVLLRESGTEPLIRIMIECEEQNACISYANEIALAIENGGHLLD
jgi:phosphoglucosamine mutase